MKIIRYGEITFREGEGPDVRGWLIEREPEDPADATNEQLILGFAIKWAQEKFRLALNSAVLDIFRKRRAEEQENGHNPTTKAN